MLKHPKEIMLMHLLSPQKVITCCYRLQHPAVQRAAYTLIKCLSCKGDLHSLKDAERFAQATLDSVRDPSNQQDQQSHAVADGYLNLAKVIHQQEGDLVKAETLARESLRIMSQLYRHLQSAHESLLGSTNLLARIFMAQGKLGSETKEMLDRYLAIGSKHWGPDGINTAGANGDLGYYHYFLANTQEGINKEHLCQSITFYKETVRIYTKIHGPDDPRTMKFLSNIHEISGLFWKFELRFHFSIKEFNWRIFDWIRISMNGTLHILE
jgi:hypothetical protein